MPRQTRAAKRAQTILEDSTDGTITSNDRTSEAVSLPPTPKPDRAPLEEIGGNVAVAHERPLGKGSAAYDITTMREEAVMAKSKPQVKGKKGKGGAKKGAKKRVPEQQPVDEAGKDVTETGHAPNLPLVEEDERQAAASPASEAACEDLVCERDGEGWPALPLEDATVSPSPAAQSAGAMLLPAVEQTEPTVKAAELAAEAMEPAAEPGKPDSPRRSAVASPLCPRATVQPEDSIEAIDALEEAIEEVGRALPNLHEPSSPEKRRQRRELSANGGTSSKSTAHQKSTQTAKARGTAQRASKVSPPTHPAPKAPVGRSTSVRVTMQKPAQPNISRKPPARRPVSVSYPAPQAPLKSTKPPTKPSFTLPGEAVAAKLKAQREQREERMKLEDEAAAKRRNFKARPVPIVGTPDVKQTAASRARKSLMIRENMPPTRTSSIGTSVGGKRTSTISISKRTSTAAPTQRVPSVTKPNPGPLTKSVVTAKDVASQRQKAREIFNRDRVEKEEREKERRQKEEAAKRARVEAAERGRQASREWAEKQRTKRVSVAAGAPAVDQKRPATVVVDKQAGVDV